jgi:hypothetical protein
MDSTLFSDKSPGYLWEIAAHGKPDWAFIPDALPAELSISSELQELLAQAREELARLDGIGRVMPNYNLLLRPLQQREFCNTTDPTARSDIQQLVTAEILAASTIIKRPKIFIAPAIFKVVFGD